MKKCGVIIWQIRNTINPGIPFPKINVVVKSSVEMEYTFREQNLLKNAASLLSW